MSDEAQESAPAPENGSGEQGKGEQGNNGEGRAGEGRGGQAKPGASAGKAEQPKTGKSSDSLGAEQREFTEEQRGFNDAFWQGQRFLSPDMLRHGPTVIIGRADIRDMQVGDRTQISVGDAVSRTLGTVREDVLIWVRRRYVEAPEYQSLRTILAERRVLFLRGQPGTGRFTTALHLLDGVASSRIFRVEGKKAVLTSEKRDFPEKNAGYVTELSREDGSLVTEEKLDKLRDILVEQLAFCVLIAEPDARDPVLFGDYARSYTSPDPGRLLRKHTFEEVTRDDPPGFEQRLTELLDTAWVAEALGPCPRPMESVRMAALLAGHARGEATREHVERKADEAVGFQISEWFAPLQALQAGAEHDEALHLTAFRVTLAVLNESPYHLVANAAEKLGAMLIEASADRQTRHASLFSDDPASRLPALRAKIVDGYTTFGSTRVPMRLLTFHDDRYPVAILRYVWENHHRMAITITEWLRNLLSEDTRPLVWVRAAHAVGLLGSLDYSEVFTKTINPTVQSITEKPENRWQCGVAAAVALDRVAQHEHLRAVVRERLRSWRRNGTFAERWTTAAAQGFVLGRQDVSQSLEELRVLGTPSERQRPLEDGDVEDHAMVAIAGFSIAKLFAFGEVDAVLDHLLRWITDSRSSLRALAQCAVRHLVDFYGFELDHLDIGAGRELPALPEKMKQWPLLLSVQERNPEFTEPIAELLRQLLRREGDYIAKQFLGKWIRQSERNAELLASLAGFVPHIVWNAGDENRLIHLLDRMSKDWADPLHEDVAARLREAIISSRVGSSST